MAGNVMEFTDANWESEVLESAIPVLVDFWAPWCGPCRMLAPTIEKLADEYGGKVKVGKMDTDQNSTPRAACGSRSSPPCLLPGRQGSRPPRRRQARGKYKADDRRAAALVG